MRRKHAPLTQDRLRENAELGVIDDRDDEPYGHLREKVPKEADRGQPPIADGATRRSHRLPGLGDDATHVDVA
jgi:hypothetical protein